MLHNAEELRKEIGHRIRVRRVECKMLQKDLGAALGGVKQTQISEWEGGRRMLRMEDAMEIAKVLNTTVGYLAGEQPRAA
jgi:transcriptional regulator with XRE-family HTH domain